MEGQNMISLSDITLFNIAYKKFKIFQTHKVKKSYTLDCTERPKRHT